MTDSGRTVYGGGGITPDEKYVQPKLDRLETRTLREVGVLQLHALLFRPARRNCPKAGCRTPRS